MVTLEHKTYKCTQCYDCVKYCSGKALKYCEGVIIFYSDNCALCEVCMDVCDNNAIKVKE